MGKPVEFGGVAFSLANAAEMSFEAADISRRLRLEARNLEAATRRFLADRRPKREAIAFAHERGAKAVDEIIRGFSLGIIPFALPRQMQEIVRNPAAALGDASESAKHTGIWKPAVFLLFGRKILPWLERDCLKTPGARKWAVEENPGDWPNWAANVIRAFAKVFTQCGKRLRSVAKTQSAGHRRGGALPTVKKLPRQTRGGSATKLIAALTKHHNYADGGCLNWKPIGNNDLAKAAGVSKATTSRFFKHEFKGYKTYKTQCENESILPALRLMNQDVRSWALSYQEKRLSPHPDDE